MRQIIKYTTLSFYYLMIGLFFYEVFSAHFLYLIPLIIFLLMMFFQNVDDIKIVIFSPELDKKVIHECGIYYVYHSNTKKEYILYKDYIIFKLKIYSFDSEYIYNGGDINKRIKDKLDYLYAKELEVLKKGKILDEWDGYTSTEVRRDHKISEII